MIDSRLLSGGVRIVPLKDVSLEVIALKDRCKNIINSYRLDWFSVLCWRCEWLSTRIMKLKKLFIMLSLNVILSLCIKNWNFITRFF